jgi:hypothetical protein
LTQASEERGPKGLGLGLADVDREDLAAAGLMDAVRDHQRLVDHPTAGADLLDLGIQEQVRIAALQRPGAEGVDIRIERAADPADLALGDTQAQALDELIHPAGRHAADVGLLNDR